MFPDAHKPLSSSQSFSNLDLGMLSQTPELQFLALACLRTTSYSLRDRVICVKQNQSVLLPGEITREFSL